MPWFITRRGVLLAAVLALVSVGWAGFSSSLPQSVRSVSVAIFAALIVVAVIVAVNAQSRRMSDEWRREEGRKKET